MEQGRYEARWPKDNLHVSCYVHEVMNFRYHWHPEDYELNVLLFGSQTFCTRTTARHLSAGDVILVDTNEGHASYGQSQGTIALVLHFSASAFKQFLKKGTAFSLASCRSDDITREELRYREVRRYAVQVYTALAENGPFAQYQAKAALEQLIATLLCRFSPVVISSTPEVSIETQRAMRDLMGYIEIHYKEPVSLEEIAALSQYSRTYISALFKKAVGVNFYEYLTRVRFQHALLDLAETDKTLTEIALSNGFSELKAFNKHFRGVLGCLPGDYRKMLQQGSVGHGLELSYIPFSEPAVHERLMKYLTL